MLKKMSLFFALALPFVAWLQTGGVSGFSFLNSYYSARQLGLGDLLCISDGDLQSTWSNPATLSNASHNKVLVGQTLLAGGVNTGSLNYGRTLGNYFGSAHFRYIAYGQMNRTDINGTDLGTFSPGDFIVGASAAKAINERMYIGATLNLLYSQLDQYTAFGGAVDVGGMYRDEEKRLVVSGVVKNLGAQFKGYTETRHPLPLEVQLGISHKLKHAPFRFTLIGTNLQRWDLTYIDPNAKDKVDPLTGDTIKVQQAGFFEKLGRHALFQTELLLGKKLHLRVAFDYQRRRELAVVNRPGLAGFSFGAGLYLKRFCLDYGWMIYSSAGSQHGISLTIPLKN
jgi:hypothetical protein